MATEGLWDYATDAELDAELAQYKTAAVDTVPQTQFPASSSGLDLSGAPSPFRLLSIIATVVARRSCSFPGREATVEQAAPAQAMAPDRERFTAGIIMKKRSRNSSMADMLIAWKD